MGKNVAVGNPFRVIIPQEASANAHQHTLDPWINGLNDKEVIWVVVQKATGEPVLIGEVLPEVIKYLVEISPKTAPQWARDMAANTS